MGTSLIGAAFAIGRWSSHPEGRGVDAELFGELNRNRGLDVDRFFTGITELGSLYAAGAAAAALALTGRRRAAANAFAAAGATWLIGQGLKKVANRPRPYESKLDGSRLLIAPPQGSSWPSSHPAVLTTFTTIAGRDLGLGVVSRTGLTGLASRSPPHVSPLARTTLRTWRAGSSSDARSPACGRDADRLAPGAHFPPLPSAGPCSTGSGSATRSRSARTAWGSRSDS